MIFFEILLVSILLTSITCTHIVDIETAIEGVDEPSPLSVGAEEAQDLLALKTAIWQNEQAIKVAEDAQNMFEDLGDIDAADEAKDLADVAESESVAALAVQEAIIEGLEAAPGSLADTLVLNHLEEQVEAVEEASADNQMQALDMEQEAINDTNLPSLASIVEVFHTLKNRILSSPEESVDFLKVAEKTKDCFDNTQKEHIKNEIQDLSEVVNQAVENNNIASIIEQQVNIVEQSTVAPAVEELIESNTALVKEVVDEALNVAIDAAQEAVKNPETVEDKRNEEVSEIITIVPLEITPSMEPVDISEQKNPQQEIAIDEAKTVLDIQDVLQQAEDAKTNIEEALKQEQEMLIDGLPKGDDLVDHKEQIEDLNSLKEDIQKAEDSVKESSQQIESVIEATIGPIAEETLIKESKEQIEDALNDVQQAATEALKEAAETMKDSAEKTIEEIKETKEDVKDFVEAVTEAVKVIDNGSMEEKSLVIENLIENVDQMISNVENCTDDKKSELYNEIEETRDKQKEVVVTNAPIVEEIADTIEKHEHSPIEENIKQVIEENKPEIIQQEIENLTTMAIETKEVTEICSREHVCLPIKLVDKLINIFSTWSKNPLANEEQIEQCSYLVDELLK